MPVQAGDLDNLVVATALLIEAIPDPVCYDDQIDHAGGYVHAMEARNHEKRRAKLCCAHWVSPGPHALFNNQLGPARKLPCGFFDNPC